MMAPFKLGLFLLCVLIKMDAMHSLKRKKCDLPQNMDQSGWDVFRRKCYIFSWDLVNSETAAKKCRKLFRGRLAYVDSYHLKWHLAEDLAKRHHLNAWVSNPGLGNEDCAWLFVKPSAPSGELKNGSSWDCSNFEHASYCEVDALN